MFTEEKMAEIKQAHGARVAFFEMGEDGEDFALRPPNRAEYAKYKAESADEATADIAQTNLVRLLVVYPSPAEFEALLDKYLGLAEIRAVSTALGDWFGGRAKQVKK